MEVYAIFDNFNDCVYLCYAYADEENEYCDQVEPMNDLDWEEWLDNEPS
jgi:hypothetical protein